MTNTEPVAKRFYVRKSTAEQKLEMVAAYNSGENAPSIAKRYGLNVSSVQSILKLRGVQLRDKHERSQRYELRHDAFSSPLSEEAIYWIGMLMSDGCVIQRGESFTVSLGLIDGDWEHVKSFREFLGAGRKIEFSSSRGFGSGGRGVARLCVNSPRLAADLARYGVVPRKSLIADPIGGIEMLPAYWAGAVDGDGHLMWANKKPVIGITGSFQTVMKFREFVRLYSPAFNATPAPQGNVFHLRASSRMAIPVIKALYEHRLYCLPRKRDLALRIIREYESLQASKMPPSACSVSGCVGEVHGLGFCRLHYKRFRKHGSPHAVADAWNGPRAECEELPSPLPIRKRRRDASPDGHMQCRPRSASGC